jgi:hypothetical protein
MTERRRLIPEHRISGKALGRHVHHDERSKSFAVRDVTPSPLVLHKLWYRYLPVLDQGDVGACTGFAAAGMVGTKPTWPLVPAALRSSCDGLGIYRLDTTLDDVPGAWPPEDTGSTGLAAMKACQQLGLITSYRWAFGVGEVLAALSSVAPVCLGTNWPDSFDRPRSDGLVHYSADAVSRGGHEYEAVGVDPASRTIRCVNSWGRGWGDHGRFTIGYNDLERLLGEEGDAVIGLRS